MYKFIYMETNKQTAVEWLMTQFVEWYMSDDPNKPHLESIYHKALEKERLQNAQHFVDGKLTMVYSKYRNEYYGE